ncbi:hypothetical protein CDES_09055 [Corynebacterium deserti GIMN1.010]|uniref:Uncharacterized protein n=1 Tax=Corynebacterium deserti GIMN1.010 TaxID=931089 RepID=A0A0M3Q9U6_9CORY|nr:hypothetical protein [Corynebacterium deserti]ALC06203.1 hypothetical protein CDES_09055 [Corynebacterium deserti GIMN1.010]
MTKTLLKLQATLWRRTVKGNTAAWTMIIFISVYSFLGLVGMSFMLAMGLDMGQHGVLAGVVSIGMIAYVIAAIMWPSGEGQLSPVSFAVMPIEAKELLPGFALSTVMQSRGVTAIVCTLVTTIVAAMFLPLFALPVLIVAMFMSLITTLLLGELVAALSSGSSSRISKERMSIIASVGFMLFLLGYNLLIGTDAMSKIDLLGQITKWTPLGAAAGAAEATAIGQWGEAGMLTFLAVFYLGAGIWLWTMLVNNALTAPLDRGGRGTQSKTTDSSDGRVLFLPGIGWSAGGAIFSRTLRYITRDSRLLASLITFPMLGVIFIFQSFSVDFFMIYVGLVLMAAFAGAIATNDFGYDGPSLWLNISAGVKPSTMLLPRHWASMFPGAVMFVVYAVITLVLADNLSMAVLIVFIATGILISSAAVSLFVTTFNPYPTSKPGTSPWGDKSGYSGAAFLGAFASLFLGWVPTIPAIALGVYGYINGITAVIIGAELLAIAVPIVVYLVVVKACLSRVNAKMPEIFDKVKAFVK